MGYVTAASELENEQSRHEIYSNYATCRHKEGANPITRLSTHVHFFLFIRKKKKKQFN